MESHCAGSKLFYILTPCGSSLRARDVVWCCIKPHTPSWTQVAVSLTGRNCGGPLMLTLPIILLYIQKEMHRMHTETTRSSGYWLGTVLLLYLLRTDAARVAGCVTTRSRSARRGRLGGRCRCCNTLLPRSRCRRSSNPSSRQIRAAQLERVELEL